jgi:hypothetical protein
MAAAIIATSASLPPVRFTQLFINGEFVDAKSGKT